MNSIFVLMGIFSICALYAVKQKGPKLLLAVADGDEDMKIADGHYSPQGVSEDSAEQAACEFMRQKQSGNVDKARELGMAYAKEMLRIQTGFLDGEMEQQSQLVQHHQYLLYTYVVNRVIAEHSPNSILAQTSLNVFYSQVEADSLELYKHISDMAGFSLYILCERSSKRTDDEIGRIFASLCRAENHGKTIAYGNMLYQKLYNLCKAMVEETEYDIVPE